MTPATVNADGCHIAPSHRHQRHASSNWSPGGKARGVKSARVPRGHEGRDLRPWRAGGHWPALKQHRAATPRSRKAKHGGRASPRFAPTRSQAAGRDHDESVSPRGRRRPLSRSTTASGGMRPRLHPLAQTRHARPGRRRRPGEWPLPVHRASRGSTPVSGRRPGRVPAHHRHPLGSVVVRRGR